MRIAGKETTWQVTSVAADLSLFAAPAPGAGPEGQDALKLSVDLDRQIEAMEERIWPVQAGQAYRLSTQTRSALNRSHGQLFLVWLDAADKVIAEEGSDYTFAKHEYAPLAIYQVAPTMAVCARACFRLVGDVWPDLKGIQGDIWLSPATLEPSLEAHLEPTVAGALYDACKPVDYRLSCVGAPSELDKAELRYQLHDYDGKLLAESTCEIKLCQGQADMLLSLQPLGAGYYELSGVLEGAGLASVHLVRSFGCLSALDFNPAQDSPIACDAGISWPFEKGNASEKSKHNPQRFATQSAACYKLGLRSLRDRFGWNETQPTKESFDWGRYRQAAKAQHAAGLDVYQMQSDVPLWAQDAGENAGKGKYPPADVKLAYEFGARLAREMGHSVRFIEFWNEPDIFFYSGHPWDLAAFAKAGALGVKDTDPTLGVLGGSRCNTTEFWRKWLANGVGPYIDIFNQHSYGKPEDQFALIQQDRDIMAEVGLERPIWMTEMGQRSSPSPDGSYTLAERIQVVYLLRAYVSGLAAGLDRFFYFYLQEFLEAGIHLWGLQRHDLSPKPAVLALGALIRQVGRAKMVGCLIDDERYCIVFERLPGDFVGVAWSTKNSVVVSGWDSALPNLTPGQDWTSVDGEFSLPVHPGACIVDAMGRQTQECTGDSVEVKLSLCPVFIRGLDTSRMKLVPPAPNLHYVPSKKGLSPERHIWLQAQCRPGKPMLKQADAQAQKNALFTSNGQPEEIALIVHNYQDESSRVTVTVKLPEDWTLECVNTSGGSIGTGTTFPLVVAAHTSECITVNCKPGELKPGEEYSVKSWLYLDGAPHDQVAVYYKGV
ncbi:MAG: hypothetical protein ACYCZF_09950 [Anaerolineae bacterium]